MSNTAAALIKKVVNAIAGISNPDVLDMTSISFCAHRLIQGVCLKVRRLAIHNTRYFQADYDSKSSTKVLDIFSGERLEHLTVLSTAYCPKILRALKGQNNCTMLRFLCLDFHVEESSVLIPFLVSCPNLETIDFTLRIPPSDSFGVLLPETIPPPPYLQLPRSALKNLRSVSGPADMVMAFVPGRPVRDVTIKYEREYYGHCAERSAPLEPLLLVCLRV